MNRVLLVMSILLCLTSCNLVTIDEKLLASHKQTQGKAVSIYYVSVGATAEDVIQVRKEGANQPIWVSKNYDTLLSSRLVNDTSLELVLGSKGIYNKMNSADTLTISINNQVHH